MRKTRYLIYGLMLVGLSVIGPNCATEPDPLDRTQPQAVNKKMLDGEWYYNVTTTDADYEDFYTFIGQEVYQHVMLRWEITQDKLNGIMVPESYRDEEGNFVQNKVNPKSVVLSFPIKKHYDIRYRYNSTTREELNVIEENTDRPWNEREYMEVDWSQNTATNIWAPLGFDQLFGDMTRESVAVYENVDFYSYNSDPEKAKSSENDVQVDTRKWNPESDPAIHAINIDTKESIMTNFSSPWWWYNGYILNPTTVRFRHSLLKAVPADQNTYEAMEYRDDFFRRYGYFRTEYAVWDEQAKERTETEKKYYINRWDLSDGKKITWYMSPDFQEAVNAGDTVIKDWAIEAINSWNKAFQEATGRDDTIVELKENELLTDKDGNPLTRQDGTKRWKYELGDLRYSMFNVTFKLGKGQPCGYGPSTADPSTGQIFHGSVNIYAGGCYDWVTKRAMDYYDLASGNCTIEEFKNGRYFNSATGKCDAGDTSTPLNGPVVAGGSGSTSSGSTNGQSNTPQDGLAGIRFLSPALKTAYWPKSDITKAKFEDIKLAQKDIEKFKARFKEEIQNPTMMNLDGFKGIAGTQFESQLVPQNIGALLPDGDAPSVSALLQFSPAQRLTPEAMSTWKTETIKSLTAKDDIEMFEPGIHAFVKEMKGKPREEVASTLRRWIYLTSMIHEMGHTLGLRHNFMGSVDQRNFPNPNNAYTNAYNDYWKQVTDLRAQYQSEIDKGNAEAYNAYVDAVDKIASTKDRYGSTSVMEYMGDWSDWNTEARPYDRAAILFGYGKKVEVKNDKTGNWDVVDYKDGDFVQNDPLSETEKAKSGRKVRSYLFCSDEKVYEDVFCSWFDRGVTATEITRNFIADSQIDYFFRNFKRDRVNFEGSQRSYYFRKWKRDYYTHVKPLTQFVLNIGRYPEFISALNGADGNFEHGDIYKIFKGGPEDKDMRPGYYRDGGEDVLRSMMLIYYYLIYDVLMRPDYGKFQLQYNDNSGAPQWQNVERYGYDETKPTLNVTAGQGWGFTDKYDILQDPQIYYEKLQRIGVELDKIIALEVLSIPCVLSDLLWYQKANGATFWNMSLTGYGSQLWQIASGLITDNMNHVQNPYCVKCDAACKANPKDNPPQLKTYPINLLESIATQQPTARCQGDDEAPIQAGYDPLFAIKPIFFAISGASHPWYHNHLVEHLDSQVKGGNHRFDISEELVKEGKVAEFTNGMGTKTYQAVQTSDGFSVSYGLVKRGQGITERFAYVQQCFHTKDQEVIDALKDKDSIYKRSCDDLWECYRARDDGDPPRAEWCESEGWDIPFVYTDATLADHDALNRIEAMLIMMQDMVDLEGHFAWRTPSYYTGGY